MVRQIVGGIHKVIDIHRFSSLRRLQRVIAWVQRFLARIRAPTNQQPPDFLTMPELSSAEHLWFQAWQTEAFSLKRDALRRETATRSLPIVCTLDLFLDEDILRCGGRLDWSALPDSAKHPILLP